MPKATAKAKSPKPRGKTEPKTETKAVPVTGASISYADAGVDIAKGDRAKDRIKFLAQKTFTRSVMGGIGGFGALFKLDLEKWKHPILVSSADGVGRSSRLRLRWACTTRLELIW